MRERGIPLHRLAKNVKRTRTDRPKEEAFFSDFLISVKSYILSHDDFCFRFSSKRNISYIDSGITDLCIAEQHSMGLVPICECRTMFGLMRCLTIHQGYFSKSCLSLAAHDSADCKYFKFMPLFGQRCFCDGLRCQTCV